MALSIIGAGLGRTGTWSLKFALEELGFVKTHHMSELLVDPAMPERWRPIAEGRPADWDAVFEGYRASVDWPSCGFYAELAAKYPQAKVILTVRDPERWFRSTQETIFDPEFLKLTEELPISQVVRSIVLPYFGGHAGVRDRRNMLAVFERHNEEVRRRIPRERLLVYDVAHGWQPLCSFLGLPVPEKPFPKVNSTEEFRSRGRAHDVPPAR